MKSVQRGSRHRYLITRRPEGGWHLRGPSLPYVMQYGDEVQAMDYARFLLRNRGGSVVLIEPCGNSFIETVVPSGDDGLRLFNGREPGA